MVEVYGVIVNSTEFTIPKIHFIHANAKVNFSYRKQFFNGLLLRKVRPSQKSSLRDSEMNGNHTETNSCTAME